MSEIDRRSRIINTHLDELRSIVAWALPTAFIFYWAGLSGDETIKAFDIEVPRKYGFWFACMFYLAVNFRIADAFFSIGIHFRELDQPDLVSAASLVEDNSWFANPFCWSDPWRRSKGIFVLILIWWFCNSSLFTLMDSGLVHHFALLGLFSSLGLATLHSIHKTWTLARNELINNTPGENPKRFSNRENAAFAAIVTGLILHTYTLYLDHPSTQNQQTAMSDRASGYIVAQIDNTSQIPVSNSYKPVFRHNEDCDIAHRASRDINGGLQSRAETALIGLTNLYILSKSAGKDFPGITSEENVFSGRKPSSSGPSSAAVSVPAAISSLATTDSLSGGSSLLRDSAGRFFWQSGSLPGLHLAISASASSTASSSLAVGNASNSQKKSAADALSDPVREFAKGFIESIDCLMVLPMSLPERDRLQSELIREFFRDRVDAVNYQEERRLSEFPEEYFLEIFYPRALNVFRDLDLISQRDIDVLTELQTQFSAQAHNGQPEFRTPKRTSETDVEKSIESAEKTLHVLRSEFDKWTRSESFTEVQPRLRSRISHILSSFSKYDRMLQDLLDTRPFSQTPARRGSDLETKQ